MDEVIATATGCYYVKMAVPSSLGTYTEAERSPAALVCDPSPPPHPRSVGCIVKGRYDWLVEINNGATVADGGSFTS